MTSTSNRRPSTAGTRSRSTRPGTGRSRLRGDGPCRARYRGALLFWGGALAVAAAIAVAMLVTRANTVQAGMSRPAPAFTLPSTSGANVSLASYRGRDVVLYFSEGVGCDACFYQMREFEDHSAELAAAGITVLPVVVNPADEVRPEMASIGLRTPFLIDANGATSQAYGVLGKGMHAGLPGHSFVLIDASGTERWYGEYPSMYLSASGLIAQVKAHLHT